MGIREDMETLKFLQQQSAMRQGAPGQQMPMMQPMGGMPQEGGMPMQDMQEREQMMQQQGQGMIPPAMQQRPQALAPRNPLEAGSRAAVEASKRSLEMNENENRRALGRAVIGMMSGISNSPTYGQGLAGNLGAMNAGFAPALGAYDAERDRIMQMNHVLSIQQKEEAALAREEEREMKRMAHEMEIAQKKLGIDRGYLDIERQKKIDERAENEAMSSAGAHIPLHTLSPSNWNRAQADIKSYIDKGDASIPALQAIDTIENVIKNDPNVTKHWGTVILAAQRNDPSIIGQQLGNRVPEKTRINAERLSKSISTLVASKFKGVPARGLTAFAEKILKEGTVSIDMHPKSILKMVGPDKKYFSHNVEARDDVYENLEKGIYHIPKPMKLELEKDEEESPIGNMTPEQAEVRKAQIRAQLGQ